MKEKNMKRKRGRPRHLPKSAEELREQSLVRIKQARQRRLAEEGIDVPAFVDEVEAITGKHKFTSEEKAEIRRKVDLLYQEFVINKWEEEERTNRKLNAELRERMLETEVSLPPVKTMTREEWNVAHGRRPDGSKKRGPAPKKKKTVFELSPGERGTAEKPGEPIDFEAMEKELEARLMDEYIAQREEQPQYALGKRLRKDQPPQRKRASTQSFWI